MGRQGLAGSSGQDPDDRPWKLNTMLGFGCGMIRFNNLALGDAHDVRKPEPNLKRKQVLERTHGDS